MKQSKLLMKHERSDYCYGILSVLILSLIIILSPGRSVSAATVYNTDVSTATSGNVLIGVAGNYKYVAESTILNRINAIRQEAYKEGITEKYVPLKWSSDLEWIAQIRAAEAGVYRAHVRPNGQSCFSLIHNGTNSYGENLAWNWAGLMSGIEQWYDEKYDYVHDTGGETGHYINLINPYYEYIGIGTFAKITGGWKTVAAEFGMGDDLNTSRTGMRGDCIQILEVEKSHVGTLQIQGTKSLNEGKTTTLSVYSNVTFNGAITQGLPLGNVTFTSSNPSVASITANGRVTARKTGTATITAVVSTGERCTAAFKVLPPAKGTKLKSGTFTYRVKKVGKEVELLKYAGKKASVSVPASVKINGISYKVTGIAAKAFQGNKYLKKVTVGKNTASIGGKAFYNCKKLKNITISTKKLKASTVGAKAFQNIYKTAKIKVPSTLFKKYTKILRKKGAGKKVKIVK